MVELGVKLTCEMCLRSEVSWIDEPAPGLTMMEALRSLVITVIRGTPRWRKVQVHGGKRIHLCPECHRKLGLVRGAVPAAATVG